MNETIALKSMKERAFTAIWQEINDLNERL